MNINKMMKQAQEMQKRMQEAQSKLDELEVKGTSGGDMIAVTLTGKGDAKKIEIDSKLVDPDDVEVLEDLIIAAFNDAKKKVEDAANEEMSKVTGGMSLPPGMKLPF